VRSMGFTVGCGINLPAANTSLTSRNFTDVMNKINTKAAEDRGAVSVRSRMKPSAGISVRV